MSSSAYLRILPLLLLLSCRPAETPSAVEGEAALTDHFYFLDSLDLQRQPDLATLCHTAIPLLRPEPRWQSEVPTGWAFAPGDPANGLRATYAQKPAEDSLVDLPHRLPTPNWPFWYEKRLLLPEDVVLYANGDDGVQCFLDGRLQEPVFGDYFPIYGSDDSVTVTLRVLNNAMAGGLRSVRIMRAADFARYQGEREVARLADALIYQAFRACLGRSRRPICGKFSPALRCSNGLRSAATIPFSRLDQKKICTQLVSTGHPNQALSQQPAAEPAQWARLRRALQAGTAVALRAALDEFPTLPLPRLDTSAVEAAPNFSFTAWGDSQGGWRTFAQLVRQMAAGDDAFSIGLGDLVAHGIDERQWWSYTQCLQPLLAKQPVYSIVGNHDYDGYYNDLNPLLYKRFVLDDTTGATYLAWTRGGAYFLALDPNEAFPLAIAGEQRAWLAERMASRAWREADWRFLLIHQPPYSQGWPGYEGDAFIREIVDSLAAAHRIDFVLSGHSHDYERLTKKYGARQTHFFILGGAGGGLEPPESSPRPVMDTIIKQHHFARFSVSPERVTVAVYGLEGEVLDAWEGRR